MPPLAEGVLVEERLDSIANYENISCQKQVVVVVVVVVRMGKIMPLVYLLANNCQWQPLTDFIALLIFSKLDAHFFL